MEKNETKEEIEVNESVWYLWVEEGKEEEFTLSGETANIQEMRKSMRAIK
jgi:hypothetical protein